MSQLNSDSLRVQVLRWFEINVDARSGKEALVVAENLPRAHSKRAADGSRAKQSSITSANVL